MGGGVVIKSLLESIPLFQTFAASPAHSHVSRSGVLNITLKYGLGQFSLFSLTQLILHCPSPRLQISMVSFFISHHPHSPHKLKCLENVVISQLRIRPQFFSLFIVQHNFQKVKYQGRRETDIKQGKREREERDWNSNSLKSQSRKYFQLENNSQRQMAFQCLLASQSAAVSKSQKTQLGKQRGIDVEALMCQGQNECVKVKMNVEGTMG